MSYHHEILGVDKGASKAEIKIAYRKLSKKFHPDLNNQDEFYEQMFVRIKKAYDTLIQGADNDIQSYEEEIYKTKTTEITHFYTDKKAIKRNEIFTVYWKTSNTKRVNILPLGRFGSEGVESYKFTKLPDKKVPLTIVLFNENNQKVASKTIYMDVIPSRYSLEEYMKTLDFTKKLVYAFVLIIILIFLYMLVKHGVRIVEPEELIP